MLSLSTHSYLTADLSPSSYKIKVNKCSWAEKKEKKEGRMTWAKGGDLSWDNQGTKLALIAEEEAGRRHEL